MGGLGLGSVGLGWGLGVGVGGWDVWLCLVDGGVSWTGLDWAGLG